MCVFVCVCDLLFDLVRPPSQGPASYQIKAASSGLWKELCVCACVRRGGQECTWGRGVFVAFNPGQWGCKGERQRALFELMKRKPFTLLHKDARLTLLYGFPRFKVKQSRTKYFICSVLLTVLLLSTQTLSRRQKAIHSRSETLYWTTGCVDTELT